LRFLTRADLGREFESACRIALAEWQARPLHEKALEHLASLLGSQL